MPRIYKGQNWEIQYRKQVRSIRKGLTASANGRATIKSTQLILKDSNDPSKYECICSNRLPWTKKDRNRNLNIIRNAFNRMDNSINLSFKSAIHLSADHYDLAAMKKKVVKNNHPAFPTTTINLLTMYSKLANIKVEIGKILMEENLCDDQYKSLDKVDLERLEIVHSILKKIED